MIVLMYKETFLNTNQLDASLPSFIISLLQEYDDVFLEEVPNGLPPIRGIEHQIDFVPDATIPNQLACLSTPRRQRSYKGRLRNLWIKGTCEKA